MSDHALSFRSSFEHFIDKSGFPCVGAKSARLHNEIEFFTAYDIESAEHDALLATSLQKFVARQTTDSLFVSFVGGFLNSRKMNEIDFERALWARLQGIHDVDRRSFSWDPTVSDDPESPDFSVSIGGKGFYVVGLHPESSRIARRFEYSAMVFNLHSQFERLRADGRYQRMKDAIIERDIALCGSANPMLAIHGESSEARQYSGRAVEDNWRCPFST